MDGACGAGKVEDLIDLHVQGEGDVVPHDLEARVVEEMHDVVVSARVVVVDTQDLIASVEEAFAKMGAEEAGPTRDEDPAPPQRAHQRDDH